MLREWKTFEEIRKVRAETAKLGSFSQDELEKFFDDKINRKLDEAVHKRALEMIGSSGIDEPRKAEIDSELSWALKALFARVERGMRVEVRVEYLPNAKDDAESESPDIKVQREILDQIAKMREELAFPKIEAEPILALTDNRQA